MQIEITRDMINNLQAEEKIKLTEMLLGSFYDDMQIVSDGNAIVVKVNAKVSVLYYEED